MPVEARKVQAVLDDSERRTLGDKAHAATLGALRALGGEADRDAIRERALADGDFSTRELAAAPPEAAAQKFERMVDYHLSWALTNLKRDGVCESPSWGVWRLVGAAPVPATPASRQPAPASDRLAELRAMAYAGAPSQPQQPPRRSLLRRRLLAG